MRVSAIDALQRGLRNLRANPMLIALQVAQGLIVTALGLAGLAPLVILLGAGAARQLWMAGQQGWNPAQSAELEGMIARLLEQWPMLLAALAAGGAVWTVGFLVYCWFQAGVLGRLAAGEAAAGGDPKAAAGEFRAYSWAAFSRDATARTWKFFWLVNLLIVVGMVVLFLVILAVSLLLALTGGEPNLAAAIAAGCLLLLFTLVVFFFLFAWTGVAKAEMAVADSGILEAFRRSLGLMWRRLGGVLLLMLLFIVASVALGIVFMPLSLALDFAIGDSIGRQIAADLALMVVQMPLNAALTVALSAAFVALVRGER